jgi:hypothetical protein
MSGNDEVDWWAVECSKFGQVQSVKSLDQQRSSNPCVASRLVLAKVRSYMVPSE